MGGLLLLAIFFTTAYSITGRYRPAIPPPRRQPAVNGYNDYLAAARMAGWKPPNNFRLDPPNIPVLLKFLNQNKSALATLRIGLTRECVAFYSRDPNATWDDSSGFHNLSRLLAAEQVISSNRGDYAGVFDSGLDDVKFSIEIMRGGPLINAYEGLGCQSIVQRRMATAVEHLTAAQCDRVVGRLLRILARQTPEADILNEERAFSLTCMVKTDRSGSSDSPDSERERWEQMFGGMQWHFAKDRAIHEVDNYYSKAIDETRKPRSQRVQVTEPISRFARDFTNDFDLFWTRYARMDVNNRLLLCVLAIRSYRLKHSRLPESLSVIGLPPFATTDPCTARPFIYRPVGNDYLLYSVGPDGRDDGGIPANEAKMEPIQGDMGILRFGYRPDSGNKQGSDYRRVPHMKSPILPNGAPPLKS